jgi:uncharacterized membrane protein
LIPSSEQEWAVSTQDIRRYMRLYMPRTLADLLGNTDVVMLSNTAANYFRPEWIGWIAAGTEEGMGLVMVGGYCSFGGYGYPDWGPTQVGSILPVETIVSGKRDFAFRLFAVEEGHPLLSVFDWEKGPLFFALNRVTMKQGSRLLATSDPESRPLLALQYIGKGSSLAFMSTWGLPWGDDLIRWEYFFDFSADMVYYAAGLEIPDPVIVHEIRLLLENFHRETSMVRSLLDFAERLGGRTTKVQKMLDELVLARSWAEDLYIEQDYAGCKAEMESLVEEMSTLDEVAVKAKDAAFMWIYLTEWSAITGTAVLSGLVLYHVMVRRGLYREVSTTKAG